MTNKVVKTDSKKPLVSNNTKNRLSNVQFWVSFFALIPPLCSMFEISLPLGEWDVFVNAICALMIALGIWNNPTTKNKGLADDK